MLLESIGPGYNLAIGFTADLSILRVQIRRLKDYEVWRLWWLVEEGKENLLKYDLWVLYNCTKAFLPTHSRSNRSCRT